MRIKFPFLATTSILLFFSINASASLIDHSTYTADTVSGLDWLDVTTTANQSYNDVSSQLGSGQAYDGWRYATDGEFNALVSNAGNAIVSNSRHSSDHTLLAETDNHSAADVLTMLLGSTLDSWWMSDNGVTWDADNGYAEGDGFDSVSGILAPVSTLRSDRHITGVIWDDERSNADDWFAVNEAGTYDSIRYQNFGSYLVRSTTNVPEPTTIGLLGLSLIGLLLQRKMS